MWSRMPKKLRWILKLIGWIVIFSILISFDHFHNDQKFRRELKRRAKIIYKPVQYKQSQPKNSGEKGAKQLWELEKEEEALLDQPIILHRKKQISEISNEDNIGDSINKSVFGEIKQLYTNYCLDSLGHDKEKEEVGAYPCHGGGGTQKFCFTGDGKILIRDLCLDASASNPDKILLYKCHERNGKHSNQFWSYDEDSQQIKHASGECLEISPDIKGQKLEEYTLKMRSCGDLRRRFFQEFASVTFCDSKI